MYHPTDRITHTTAFVTPVMEHWLERDVVRETKALFNVVRNCPEITASFMMVFLLSVW